MPLPEPSSFVGNGPDYNQYLQQGFAAAQAPIAAYNDAQAQVAKQAQLQAQIQAIQQRNQLDALLAPGEVTRQNLSNQQTQQDLNQSTQLFPLKLNRGGLENTALSQENQLRAINLQPIANLDAPYPSAIPGTNTVRQTIYSPGETHSDPDTDAGRTSTGGPLLFATPKVAGTAAVDPSVIPYGSIIQRADGSTYVAADTGGAVKARTASQGGAPVIDFASKDSSIPDYGPVKITPPTADYVKLSPAAKLAYHAMAVGLAGKGQDVAVPDAIAGTDLSTAASQAQVVPAIPNPQGDLPTDGGPVDSTPLIPIGAPNAQGQFIAPVSPDPVHPAIQTAIDTANKTAGIAPLASNALTQKALDVHQSMTPPIGSATMVPTLGYFDPSTRAFVQTSDRRMVPAGAEFGSHLIPATNEVKDAEGNVIGNTINGKFVPLKSTRKTQYIQTTDSDGNPVQQLRDLETNEQIGDDVKAKSAGVGRSGLTSAQRENNVIYQAYQRSKPIQNYLSVASNEQSILENLAIPKDQRTAADDDALRKAVAGVEQPGTKPTVADLSALSETAGYGDHFQTATSGVFNKKRLLGDGQVDSLGQIALRKLQGMKQSYNAEMNQLINRATATNVNPTDIFDPQALQYYQGIGTPNAINPTVTLNGQTTTGVNSAANLKTPDAATLSAARAAIATKGRDAVIKRLQASGYDATGL